MPIFKIHHLTRYEYATPVTESINEIKIFPYNIPGQEVLQHDILITGAPNIDTFLDYWNNKTGVFNLLTPHTELLIESRVIVRTQVPTFVNTRVPSDFEALYREATSNLQFTELATPDKVENQQAFLDIRSAITSENVAATIESCCNYIYDNFKYIKGITTIETTVDEIIEQKAGVCQDFAHLMLQILRYMGIPSRYVSGYICPNRNGMRGEGATHAWVEAWVPGYGWAGSDPTNNIWAAENHIKLAVGKNFNDCTPVKGSFKGPSRQRLSVHVSIGYEDGALFEETNNVRMETAGATTDAEIMQIFAGQQQQ